LPSHVPHVKQVAAHVFWQVSLHVTHVASPHVPQFVKHVSQVC